MTYKKFFRRKNGENAKYKYTIAIDVETEPKTGKFVLAAAYGTTKNARGEITIINQEFYHRPELVNFIQSIEQKHGKKGIQNVAIVHHNLKFDMFYYDELIDWINVLRAGGRVISAKTFEGLQIYDTFNFYSISLEKLIQSFKLNEEGIFKIPFGKPGDTKILMERCKMDARATWIIWDRTQKFFLSEYNQSITYTAPGMAFKIFKQHFFFGSWMRTESEKDFCAFERSSYRGGRSEIFKRGDKIKHQSFDVNSMYPAVMECNDYPVPDTVYWEREVNLNTLTKRISKGKLFIAEITVKVPDMYIGPLPVTDTETGKLIFPVGIFTGVWCSPEIIAALDYGVEIIECKKILMYAQKKPLFKSWVNTLYPARIKAKKENNTALQQMLKLLLNSLYGKFGEQRGETGNFIPITGETPTEDLIGKTIIYHGINADGIPMSDLPKQEYYVVPPGDKIDSPHTFACICAFVTSYARVALLKAMKQNETGLIYCDTDSVKIIAGYPVKLVTHDTDLGAWKNETKGEFEELPFYTAKQYGDKHKGVPKKAKILCENENVRKFSFEKVIQRREAILKNLPQNAFVDSQKTLTKLDDKRVWINNESLPIRLHV